MTERIDHVADTHALVWHVTDAPELSPAARAILSDADAGNRAIVVPSIVLVEIVYLVEQGRLAPDVLSRIIEYVSNPARPYHDTPLNRAVALAVQRVPRAAVPDMPNRIIVATALAQGLPLISVDERIRAAGVVPVVW